MNEHLTETVSRAVNGDREAFGELYDAYVQDIFRFLLSKTHKKEEAQDLTSITFVKALDRIASFSPKKNSSFRAWLFTIAYHAFLDHARSSAKKNVQPLNEINDPEAPGSLTSETDTLLLSEELTRALATLNETQRATITLRIWNDCSFKEIGEILGKSESAVKMIMKRALLALRALAPLKFVLTLGYILLT